MDYAEEFANSTVDITNTRELETSIFRAQEACRFISKQNKQIELKTAMTAGVSLFGAYGEYDLLKVVDEVPAKVTDDETGLYYKKKGEHTYKRLDKVRLKEMCLDALIKFGEPMTDKEALVCIGNLINYAGRTVYTSKLDSVGIVYYGSVIDSKDERFLETPFEDLFFDREKGQLVDKLPEGSFCFRKLFDTNSKSEDNSKRNVYIPTEQLRARRDLFDEAYNSTYEALKNSNGERVDLLECERVPKMDFIFDWANADSDTYNDIINSYAESFVKPEKMAPGCFFYSGEGRNGKSCGVVILRTIWGEYNCSDVDVTALGDPHKLNDLATSCVNLSTEVGALDKVMDNQEYFKQIAAHEPVSMNVFHQNRTGKVGSGFMSYFSMNVPPKWSGEGALPLVRRTFVIYFLNNFSHLDGDGIDHVREDMATPDNMVKLLGIILAIASHRTNGRKFMPSDTMKAAIDECMNESNSPKAFRDEFTKYFVGYSSMRFLMEEYIALCKENEWEWKKAKDLGSSFMDFRRTGAKVINGKQYKNIYVSKGVNNQFNFIFSKDMDISFLGIPGIDTAEQFYETQSGSLIKAISNYIDEQKKNGLYG